MLKKALKGAFEMPKSSVYNPQKIDLKEMEFWTIIYNQGSWNGKNEFLLNIQPKTKFFISMKRCDGSDGKVYDSGLKSPGFIYCPMQEKVNQIIFLSVGFFGRYDIYL